MGWGGTVERRRGLAKKAAGKGEGRGADCERRMRGGGGEAVADTDLSPGMNAPNLWQPKEEEGEERAPPQINFAKEEEEEADSPSPTFCPRKKMGFGERKNGEGGHGGERRRRKRSQSPERLNGLLGHSPWVKGEKRRGGVVWRDFFLSVCLAYILYRTFITQKLPRVKL